MPNDKEQEKKPKPRKSPELDPEIKRIRAEANKQIQQHLRDRRSADILARIKDKLYPMMNEGHRNALLNYLQGLHYPCKSEEAITWTPDKDSPVPYEKEVD